MNRLLLVTTTRPFGKNFCDLDLKMWKESFEVTSTGEHKWLRTCRHHQRHPSRKISIHKNTQLTESNVSAIHGGGSQPIVATVHLFSVPQPFDRELRNKRWLYFFKLWFQNPEIKDVRSHPLITELVSCLISSRRTGTHNPSRVEFLQCRLLWDHKLFGYQPKSTSSSFHQAS